MGLLFSRYWDQSASGKEKNLKLALGRGIRSIGRIGESEGSCMCIRGGLVRGRGKRHDILQNKELGEGERNSECWMCATKRGGFLELTTSLKSD